MRIIETCSCGASVEVQHLGEVATANYVLAWRQGHRHDVKSNPGPGDDWRGDHGGTSASEMTRDAGQPTLGFRKDGPT